MGCTLVAALVDARAAFLVHAGDSRAYLFRDGSLRRLTNDHVRRIPRRAVPGREEEDDGERRLLVQYLGSRKPLEPDASVLALRTGDRLLLCTDGLTDPLGDDRLAALLADHPDPGAATAALVAAANAGGGPDNVTALVVDYAGARPLRAADRRPPTRTAEQNPEGVATRFHEALLAVEAPLEALAADAAAVLHADPQVALAAARRGLGERLDRERLASDDRFIEDPAAAFHAAHADAAGAWRLGHQQRLDALAEPLARVTSGHVRLCPLLPGDDTAELYRRLWHQWRSIERPLLPRLRTPRAGAAETDPAIAEMLTRHMFQAVRTMRELLVFLPQFLRDDSASGGCPRDACRVCVGGGLRREASPPAEIQP